MTGKYDKEYYFLEEAGSALDYMLAERADSETSNNGKTLMFMPKPLGSSVTGMGKVEITDGEESEFEPCDFHKLFGWLLSEKAYKLLDEFKLYKVDYYEAEIITNIKTWKKHYLMHLYNEIDAIHPKRSVYDGEIEEMDVILEELSLNEEVLDEIKLEKRLIFCLSGCSRFVVHESIVKAIEDTKLTGIEAIRVDKWNIGSMFD